MTFKGKGEYGKDINLKTKSGVLRTAREMLRGTTDQLQTRMLGERVFVALLIDFRRPENKSSAVDERGGSEVQNVVHQCCETVLSLRRDVSFQTA